MSRGWNQGRYRHCMYYWRVRTHETLNIPGLSNMIDVVFAYIHCTCMIYVYMCMCMYVCMYVCMHVCIHAIYKLLNTVCTHASNESEMGHE